VSGLFLLCYFGGAEVVAGEDWDMVFADDERDTNPTSFKFLQMAHAWKSAQGKKAGGGLMSGFAPAEGVTRDGDDARSDVASSDAGDG
jgi:crooked neck